MSKVVVGSIPEKISYVSTTAQDVAVGCPWDISWYDNDENKTVKENVLPTFPVDSSDDKMLLRAKQWAEPDYDKTKKSTVVEVENKPIKNIRLLSLEHRGQGGRAYKAVINKYYVDFREDVLMDTILAVGISPKGILAGEYVWAKIGSQMKLVRIGSELHKLIVEFSSKKDIKPLGKEDLEIGGIYQDRKKNKAVFIGYVNTSRMKSSQETPSWEKKSTTQAEFHFNKTALKKAMLFYEIPIYEKEAAHLKKLNKITETYCFHIKKTHTYIEKVGNSTIPNDIVLQLRNKQLKAIKDQILEYTEYKAPKSGYAKIDAWILIDHIEYNSEWLNVSVFGEPPVSTFDVKKLLVFS